MIGNETRRSQAERIACRTENYPAIAESHPVAGETASGYSCTTTSVVIVAPALRVDWVYPRVGGETGASPARQQYWQGLSPRGRGNRTGAPCVLRAIRSIPAWAGKPYGCAVRASSNTVYPRVGGETAVVSRCHGVTGGLDGRGSPRVGGETSIRTRLPGVLMGLSPRGRGNHGVAAGKIRVVGSIPACAGKPRCAHRLEPHRGVYPRVRGETEGALQTLPGHGGLSPRGRGNLADPGRSQRGIGSIPAWAGKPPEGAWSRRASWVYPRVGGETLPTPEGANVESGLSPRGRGNPPRVRGRDVPRGSIPAWAGKPRRRACLSRGLSVYPRVGGETMSRRSWSGRTWGLSPRGRGNRGRVYLALQQHRSIPAWAGKPSWSGYSASPLWVYPRVGGETAGSAGSVTVEPGLSPRGRGNHCTRFVDVTLDGSIPAWAGKPTSCR